MQVKLMISSGPATPTNPQVTEPWKAEASTVPQVSRGDVAGGVLRGGTAAADADLWAAGLRHAAGGRWHAVAGFEVVFTPKFLWGQVTIVLGNILKTTNNTIQYDAIIACYLVWKNATQNKAINQTTMTTTAGEL